MIVNLVFPETGVFSDIAEHHGEPNPVTSILCWGGIIAFYGISLVSFYSLTECVTT